MHKTSQNFNHPPTLSRTELDTNGVTSSIAPIQWLAQRREEEAALEQARSALELAAVKQAELNQTLSDDMRTGGALTPTQHIVFIPGPTTVAEIEHATSTLKLAIDVAVEQFAAAITPYLAGSGDALISDR